MRISFYTIDDLRLGHDPKGVTGWRLSQFLNWRDALEHYHSLPNDRVKEFGLSNGVQVLQLVRCLPLFPTDRTGYDVLLTDSIVQPLWRNETQALEVAQAAAEHLDVRYRNAGRTYHYPLVLKYLVDTVTQDGGSRTQEITPWAYKRLEWRAKQGACQNTI